MSSHFLEILLGILLLFIAIGSLVTFIIFYIKKSILIKHEIEVLRTKYSELEDFIKKELKK